MTTIANIANAAGNGDVHKRAIAWVWLDDRDFRQPNQHRRPLRTEGTAPLHTPCLLYLPTEFRQQRRKDSGWLSLLLRYLRVEVCTL